MIPALNQSASRRCRSPSSTLHNACSCKHRIVFTNAHFARPIVLRPCQMPFKPNSLDMIEGIPHGHIPHNSPLPIPHKPESGPPDYSLILRMGENLFQCETCVADLDYSTRTRSHAHDVPRTPKHTSRVHTHTQKHTRTYAGTKIELEIVWNVSICQR